MKYHVIDWAGNICLHGKEFDSFEEADEALSEFIEGTLGAVSEDNYYEERGEYYIEEKPEQL
jgi:hypothetical protein